MNMDRRSGVEMGGGKGKLGACGRRGSGREKVNGETGKEGGVKWEEQNGQELKRLRGV